MTCNGYKLPELLKGRLIKRYKRFMADVILEDGSIVTVHCPNSGAMTGCAWPGATVYLSRSANPKRKLKFTWELTQAESTLIGINTQVPNKLVRTSIEMNLVRELTGYDTVRAEVKTSDHTRLDLLLHKEFEKPCFVEIKNCTLVENKVAMFPDAVTLRGQKHLQELSRLVAQGNRGVIFYLIQRMDATLFSPAHMIDPEYARQLKLSVEMGVEIVAMDTVITPEYIRIGAPVAIQL